MSSLPPLVERISVAVNQGKLAKAEAILRKSEAAEPEYQLLHGQALVEAARGQLQVALNLLARASQLQKDYVDALLAAATICAAANQLQDAVRLYEAAIRRNDQDARGYTGLAELLIRTGDRTRGLEFMRHAYTLAPELPGLRHRLARLALDSGHFQLAEQVLQDQPELPTDTGQAAFLMSQVKARMNKPREALAWLDRVRSPELQGMVLRARATALSNLERYDEAERFILDSLSSAGNEKAALQAALGTICVFNGRPDEGQRWYEAAVQTDSTFVEAWYGLANLVPGDFTDDQVKALERLFEQLKQQGIHQAIVAAFALANVFEARRAYPRQMEWLDRGNALKRTVAPLDRDAFEQTVQSVQQHYGGPYPASDAERKEQRRPVFILGMPRSGTTLVEQIVSSHSQVAPMGESLAFAEAMDELARSWGPFDVADALKDRYEAYTSAMRSKMLAFYEGHAALQGIPGHVYTDKGITNFRNAGLLRHIFPDARFIAMHRDPVDVCLGAYKQHFTHGQHFSYGLDSLAYTLKAYQTLVAFWQEQLGGSLLQVFYEELVSQPETLIPQIVEHAGLPWEASCMAFQKNRRAVRTASTQQVRRGMEKGFLQKWRRYGDLLNPLLEALAQEGINPQAYRQMLEEKGVFA